MFILKLLITIILLMIVIFVFILAENKDIIWEFIKENYMSNEDENRRKKYE